MSKFDVFISYSRRDTAVVDKICNALSKQNVTFFIDKKGLAGGGEFPAELEEAIDNSHLVLFIASQNSYKSKYTRGEVSYAYNTKDKGNIIPYVIDNSNLLDIKGMKLIFTNINIRNINEHPIEITLMKDICELLGKSYEEPDTIVEEIEKKNKDILAEFKRIQTEEEQRIQEEIKKQKEKQEELLRKIEEEKIAELRRIEEISKDKERWEEEERKIREEEKNKIIEEQKAIIEAKKMPLKKKQDKCYFIAIVTITLTFIIGIWLGIKCHSFWIGFTIFFSPSMLSLVIPDYYDYKLKEIEGINNKDHISGAFCVAVTALALPIAVWRGLSNESFWDGAVVFFWSLAFCGLVAYIYDQIFKKLNTVTHYFR